MVNWKKGLKLSWKYISTFIAANLLYCSALHCADSFSCIFTKPLTKQNLEQLLIKERKEAGIKEDVNIKLYWNDHPRKGMPGTYPTKSELGDYYLIYIVPNFKMARIGTLKHELYHIANGHIEGLNNSNSKLTSLIKKWYWYEPQAVIYTVTGLKI